MSRFLVRLGVSLGVIAALLWWTDATRVAEHLLTLDPGWVGLSILATTCATLSMAYRWQLTASRLGIRFDYPFAVREYYIAQLVNSVLPGGVPGDVARAVRTRKEAGLKSAAKSVVAERILGQIAIMSILFFGVLTSLLWPGAFHNPTLSMTVLIVLLAALILVAALAISFAPVGEFVLFLLRLQGQTVFIALAIVSSACLVFGFYASARAAGTEIPPEGLVIVIPLVLCAMLIPLSVAGWGWREGAAAALFPVVGASSSAGVAAGITYGAVILFAALPAVAILLWPGTIETQSSTGKRNSV
ncbi:lysylphosphatidylglycerol synthase transmembrane domain-containing protein [Ruegeria sp. ANG-S4]|uniref:lysylphosphatidylglycerol synthase transmembrane domain-containing protein n=1 Tax=Ruegeria sp. ANG-S4 TaxID=1577904 RepID=UPI000689C0EB|nr:lysylphosphatidylglycerol synthase transmembrane domain-containing protein [Ruegeria sp. ANG-S4]